MRLNLANANFRLFGPDETASNWFDPVYTVSGKAWMAETVGTDTNLNADGRVMEVPSEHLCEGWLEECLLTGRHGLFSCHEAFIHIVDSMFNQHAKWPKVSRKIPWRVPIASFNILLTSHAYVNVIVAGKQLSWQWLDMEARDQPSTRHRRQPGVLP